MDNLKFEYHKTDLINFSDIDKNFKYLLSMISKINDELKFGYNSEYAAINLPEDQNLLQLIKDKTKIIQDLKPTMLIVIGIGGSNMGTEAIIQALKNKIKLNMLFLSIDTIDNYYIKENLDLVEQELQLGNKVLLNIVTKSGTTTETIVNSAIFIELLKKYLSDYQKYVIITTDKDSPLWQIGQDKYTVFEIPKLVGGRYSVLSAVGFLPFALLGIDIDRLQAGALSMRKNCLSENLETNFAAINAIINYLHYKSGKNISNLFLFDPSLFMLGNWYRQLVGESLGKNHIGPTPIISIGTTDLHSVAQLYLDGPYDKFTTFISVNHEDLNINVPQNEISQILPYITGKSVREIKNSIFHGVQKAYIQQKRPFISIFLPEKNEYYLGQLIMLKMLEIIYYAHLLNINPFDQPAVELYKKETHKILS